MSLPDMLKGLCKPGPCGNGLGLLGSLRICLSCLLEMQSFNPSPVYCPPSDGAGICSQDSVLVVSLLVSVIRICVGQASRGRVTNGDVDVVQRKGECDEKLLRS